MTRGPCIHVVFVSKWSISDKSMHLTHIFSNMLISFPWNHMRSIEASMMTLKVVLKLKGVAAIWEETDILHIFKLFLYFMLIRLSLSPYLSWDSTHNHVESHVILSVVAINKVEGTRGMILKAHNWSININKKCLLGVSFY